MAHDFRPVPDAPEWARCSRCGHAAVHYRHPAVPRLATSGDGTFSVLAPGVPFDEVTEPCE